MGIDSTFREHRLGYGCRIGRLSRVCMLPGGVLNLLSMRLGPGSETSLLTWRWRNNLLYSITCPHSVNNGRRRLHSRQLSSNRPIWGWTGSRTFLFQVGDRNGSVWELEWVVYECGKVGKQGRWFVTSIIDFSIIALNLHEPLMSCSHYFTKVVIELVWGQSLFGNYRERRGDVLGAEWNVRTGVGERQLDQYYEMVVFRRPSHDPLVDSRGTNGFGIASLKSRSYPDMELCGMSGIVRVRE